MAELLMNDDIEFDSPYFPCYVVSKANKLIPVFIGAPQTMKRGLIGIYVRNFEYPLVNHKKAYIFLHDPDAVNNDITDINWDEIADEVEDKKTGRNHIHIWK